MAIDLGATTRVTTAQDRAYLIEITREFGKDMTLVAKREVLTFDEGNAVLSRNRNIPSVFVNLSAISARSFTLGGVTITGARIAIVIEALFDLLRQEDINRGG